MADGNKDRKWYEVDITPWSHEYLNENERHMEQHKRNRLARTRKSNQENFRQQTAQREQQQGAAYAKKMQQDAARGREIRNNAYLQKQYQQSKRRKTSEMLNKLGNAKK